MTVREGNYDSTLAEIVAIATGAAQEFFCDNSNGRSAAHGAKYSIEDISKIQ